MDDAFGHWFAGLTDGEGCFTIARHAKRSGKSYWRTWPQCQFQIALRLDDADVLIMIQETLGMGNLMFTQQSHPGRPNTKPQLRLTIARIHDCLRLVEIFEAYPLRAKKRAQFQVWADAVHETAKGFDRSDTFINECQECLAELRVYVTPENLEAITQGNPPMLRHRRTYGEPPDCICGCGAPTKLVTHRDGVSFPHPANPNYCSYRRGHHRRKQPMGQEPKSMTP